MDKDKKGKKGLKCYTKTAPLSGKVYTTCNADAQQEGSKKKPKGKKRRLVLKVRPKSVEGQRPPPPRPPPPKPTEKDLADEALRKGSTIKTQPRRLKLKIKKKQPVAKKPVAKKELPDDVLNIIKGFVGKPTGKGKRANPSSWTFDMWEKYWEDYLFEDEGFQEWLRDMFDEWFTRKFDEDDYLDENGDTDIDFVDKKRRKWDRDVKNEILHFLVWKKGMMTGVGGDLHNKRRKKDIYSKVAKIPLNNSLDNTTEKDLMDLIIEETY